MSYFPFQKQQPPEELKIFWLKQDPKKPDKDYILPT